MTRFKDFSYFYIIWAIIQFAYHIFVKPTLSIWLDALLVLTLGLSASISIPFTILVDFGSSFFTLYWTN